MQYLVGLALWSGIARAAPQQAAQEPPEIVSREQPALFKTRTNLVTVPVVVRDSKGRPVGALGKDDFRLFDEGKAQVISRFGVEKRTAPSGSAKETTAGTVSATAAETAAPERFLLYVFDDIHTGMSELIPMRDAAARHIEKSLSPGDRAAIFTTSGQTALDFTNDKEQLRHSLSLLMPRPVFSRVSLDCLSTSYYSAYQIRDLHDERARSALENQITGCVKTTGPGPMPEVEPLVHAAVARALDIGDRETRLGIGALNAAVQRLAVMPGERILVLASPGFLTRLDMVHEKDQVIERAVKARIAINTLDSRGLYADSLGLEIDLRRTSASNVRQLASAEHDQSRATGMLLADLAYGTGGTLFENRNDFEQGFDRAAESPEFVYVLAFSPQNLKYDGKFHRLKIALVNSRGLTVQARLGYWAPDQQMDAAEEAKEEIREALFSREEVQELPVEIETQFFKTGEDAAKVDVMVHVDAKGIQFLKADGRNRGALTIVSAIFDQNGNGVAGNQRTLTMNLKDETLARRLEAGFTVQSTFGVKRGLYQVRVVVRDSEGQQMAARNGAVDIR